MFFVPERALINKDGNKQTTMNTATIVQKLWNYCNLLRDDGLSINGVSDDSVCK